MNLIFKLWKPFIDSVIGTLSWKEIVSALVLTMVFLFAGGTIGDLIHTLFNIDPLTTNNIIDALLVLVMSLLHKKEQGAPK